MSRLHILGTGIEGLSILQRSPMGDERGYLDRLFCDEEISGLLGKRRIRQVNQTLTAERGTVRGLHFQRPPHAEVKFVTCLRGEVFDVAIDLRQGSGTFLTCRSEILSGSNHRTYVIPEGFAHGFQTLTDDCVMLYFHTAPYNASSEDGLNVQDPLLDIRWPLPVSNLSARDERHPMIDADFSGLVI